MRPRRGDDCRAGRERGTIHSLRLRNHGCRRDPPSARAPRRRRALSLVFSRFLVIGAGDLGVPRVRARLHPAAALVLVPHVRLGVGRLQAAASDRLLPPLLWAERGARRAHRRAATGNASSSSSSSSSSSDARALLVCLFLMSSFPRLPSGCRREGSGPRPVWKRICVCACSSLLLLQRDPLTTFYSQDLGVYVFVEVARSYMTALVHDSTRT